MADDIIRVEGLSRSFGDLQAVDDVSFTVRKGEIFAFLGPNGAGKSTTINMLCTLLRPSRGQASIAGHDVASESRAVREQIGLVFQDRTLDDNLTAEQNLRFHAVVYGVPRREVDARIGRVLGIVDLVDRAKDKVSTFSGGMARRLEIARGLLHSPKVLFLDEPTVGLDPQTRAKIWKDVQRLRDEEGVTVFMTTHYMDEAEYADRIAIIDQGRIVALDTPTALKHKVGSDKIRVTVAQEPDPTSWSHLEAAFPTGTLHRDGLQAEVSVEDGGRSLMPVLASFKDAGLDVTETKVITPNLDAVFMHFTGHEIRPEGADKSGMARVMRAHRRR